MNGLAVSISWSNPTRSPQVERMLERMSHRARGGRSLWPQRVQRSGLRRGHSGIASVARLETWVGRASPTLGSITAKN